MAVPEKPGTISMARWVRRLEARSQDRSLVLTASLELTERCNLRCVHCYINRPAGDEEARKRELDTEEWKALLDDMAQAGALWLVITGGEPLLRPDWAEVYLHAKRRGFLITLMTNGTLLTPEGADLLAEYPPWQIEITLYGATAETYEAITGVPGSYARCRRAIDLLRERDLTLNLKTMALRQNVHEVRAMQAMAKQWGLFFRYDPVVHSRLDGGDRPLACRLSPEEIIVLEEEDPKRVQQWQELCGRPWLPPDGKHLFSCGAARHTFHIDPYGTLFPCLMARWLSYDLTAGSLSQALEEFLPTVRELPITHNPTCWQCDLRLICGTCPAWARREVGDPEAPEPFRCQLAHLRSQHLHLSLRVIHDAQDLQAILSQEETP